MLICRMGGDRATPEIASHCPGYTALLCTLHCTSVRGDFISIGKSPLRLAEAFCFVIGDLFMCESIFIALSVFQWFICSLPVTL